MTTSTGHDIRSAGAAAVAVSAPALVGDVSLSDIDLTSVSVGWGSLTKDADFFGNPLTIRDPSGVVKDYATGLEANANATIKLDLTGECQSFTADVGLEDTDNDHPDDHFGTITFQVRDQNGTVLAQSPGTIDYLTPGVHVDVPLAGVTQLVLYGGDGGNGNNSDHVVFADPVLHCQPSGPDVTPPYVALTTDPASPGATGWFSAPVAVSVVAQDSDSEVSVELSTDGGTTWRPYTAPVTLGDGARSVQARATDSSHNTSEPVARDIRVDTTVPVVVADVSESARTVTLGASDTGSGVERIERSVAGGPWAVYTSPVTVGAGQTTVRYRAVDRVGHVSTVGSAVVHAVGDATHGGVTTSTAAVTASGTAQYGARNVLSVRVAAADRSAVGGAVTVRDGARTIASGRVTGGSARLALPADLGVGVHTLTVAYAGSGALLSSTDQVRLVVTKAVSTLSVEVAPKKVTSRKKAKLTVKVATSTGAKAAGTARVVVKKGHKKALRKTVTVKAGKAGLKLPRLKKGTWKARVVYQGSATIATSRAIAKVKVKH